MGLIACQWAKHLGVTMIGTVGSDEKAELAHAHGCTHTILYNEENFVERVQELTGGRGADAVYDSVGRDTFHQGDCLRMRGTLKRSAKFRRVEPLIPQSVEQGFAFLTRPTLFNYIASRKTSLCGRTFEVLQSGAVKADINQEYPLSEVQQGIRTSRPERQQVRRCCCRRQSFSGEV